MSNPVLKGTGSVALGIAGAKVGFITGAAIGSFVPVVGTIIGAKAGAVSGGLMGLIGGLCIDDWDQQSCNDAIGLAKLHHTSHHIPQGIDTSNIDKDFK